MNFAICLAPDKPTDKIFNIFDVYKSHGVRILFLAKPKSDHDSFKKLPIFYENFEYISLDDQKNIDFRLYTNIDEDDKFRLNLGMLYAYRQKAKTIFLIDLDEETELNYLFEKVTIGNFLNSEHDIDLFVTEDAVLDPFQATTSTHMWHRGFPWEKLISRNSIVKNLNYRIKPFVQTSFINGSTDVDNLGKIFFQPDAQISISKPFTSNALMPFNCLNTLIKREAVPYYFIFQNLGNISDIFGSYVFQLYFKNSVLYSWPTLTRFGKKQSNIDSLEQDIQDQKLISAFFENPSEYKQLLSKQNLLSLEIYRTNFPEINFESGETSWMSG